MLEGEVMKAEMDGAEEVGVAAMSGDSRGCMELRLLGLMWE